MRLEPFHLFSFNADFYYFILCLIFSSFQLYLFFGPVFLTSRTSLEHFNVFLLAFHFEVNFELEFSELVVSKASADAAFPYSYSLLDTRALIYVCISYWIFLQRMCCIFNSHFNNFLFNSRNSNSELCRLHLLFLYKKPHVYCWLGTSYPKSQEPILNS